MEIRMINHFIWMTRDGSGQNRVCDFYSIRARGLNANSTALEVR